MTSFFSFFLSFFKFKNIFIGGIIWAILTFILCLSCQLFFPNQQPFWYRIALTVFEEGAFCFAGYLCWRNYLCTRILSHPKIWLFLALGSIVQALSHCTYYFWEQVLQGNPDFSIASFGYMTSYTFLAWGIILAVKYRAINLLVWQRFTLITIAVGAILLAWQNGNPLEISTQNFPLVNKNPPAWVLATDNFLRPATGYFNLYLVFADVLILILAIALLITFWGGRFSQTWLAIANGGLWLYIADTIYAYAVAKDGFFATGIIDSFWTFSAIFFALGASWEYDTSTRPRHR
jgi:hypothetical protein